MKSFLRNQKNSVVIKSLKRLIEIDLEKN